VENEKAFIKNNLLVYFTIFYSSGGTIMINRFEPEKFHIDLNEIAQGTEDLIWQASTAIGATYLYWVNPGLYYAAAGLGVPKAHDVREVTGKIINIWRQHTGWTFGLICVGSFLSLPSTIFTATFILGGYTGSELCIRSDARTAVSLYEKHIGKKEQFTEGYKQALFEFLCEDRNLLVHNSFWDHITKIKVLHDCREDKTIKLFDGIFHNIANNTPLNSGVEKEITAAKENLIEFKRYMWEKKFPYPKTIDSILANLANSLFSNLEKTV
jgi:hypothetical protein